MSHAVIHLPGTCDFWNEHRIWGRGGWRWWGVDSMSLNLYIISLQKDNSNYSQRNVHILLKYRYHYDIFWKHSESGEFNFTNGMEINIWWASTFSYLDQLTPTLSIPPLFEILFEKKKIGLANIKTKWYQLILCSWCN